MLSALIEAYEARHHEIPPADPSGVLRYAIEEFGRTRADLAAVLASKSRASEVLNGRRALTTEMTGKISAAWHIPVAALFPKGSMAQAA